MKMMIVKTLSRLCKKQNSSQNVLYNPCNHYTVHWHSMAGGEQESSLDFLFFSRIPLMCTLGAFLISFEGMNILFIVEDPRATSRCRTGIKALFLDNLDILNVYCVSCCHTHSHSISFLIQSLLRLFYVRFTPFNINTHCLRPVKG